MTGPLEKPIETGTAAETETVAADLARGLRGGEVLLLSGELGAGKTTFVRGLALGLEVEDPDAVSSPSFTLVNVYEGGRLRLVHADLYRLDDPAAIEELALEELLDAGAVLAIEWGEKLPYRLEGSLKLSLEITETGRRLLL